MIVGSTFIVLAAITAVKVDWGVGLGCLSPLAAFAATAIAMILWPSRSSTDVLYVILFCQMAANG